MRQLFASFLAATNYGTNSPYVNPNAQHWNRWGHPIHGKFHWSDTVLYYEEFNLTMDTLLPDYTWFPTDKNLEINRILPNSRKEFPGRHIALFEKLDGEVNMWFIFKYDTVRETPWDTIVSKYLVERRYDLTLSILDSLDWTITYP